MSVKEALQWYADEAAAIARNIEAFQAGKESAVMASVTILSLDGGKRARAALAQDNAEPVAIVTVREETGSIWAIDRKRMLPPGKHALYTSPPSQDNAAALGEALTDEQIKATAFVQWFDLYGVSIEHVVDERGSLKLSWHRGEAFGNTLRELIAAVDVAIESKVRGQT